MSRLVSMLMLWLLLLLAAAPASAVMDVQPGNHVWELPVSSYDLAGRAVRLLQPNGNLCWNVHDELGRLKSRALYVDAGATVEVTRLEWYHDALGNVVSHDEQWPVSSHRPQGWRRTNMSYDDASRLTEEVVSESAGELTRITYGYDDASNRASKAVQGGEQPGFWSYHYNESNQLRTWEKRLLEEGPVQKNGVLHYDSNGNRTSQGIQDAVGGVQLTSYAWDAQNRLKQVAMPDGVVHGYRYDHRTRRIGITKTGGGQAEQGTTVVFSGGLSLAEWEVASASLPTQIASPGVPTVEYSRGPDMGGGVGGLLYSRRGTTLKYNLSNGRGDIVAQTDGGGSLSWTASYEAYGKRTKESGANADKQRANSKDEDPTGLLNEGFRYRDLETGVWLSRDPAGFVDGPNLYAYVQQNPWTAFDPDGLWQIPTHADITSEAAKGAGFNSWSIVNLKIGVSAPDIPDGPVMSGVNYGLHAVSSDLRKNTLTTRTHHGDLQPWHFMGRSEYDSPHDVKARAIDFVMGNVSLYNGADPKMSGSMREKHLGAALHTIQDSFSEAHVSRDPKSGLINRVQDYGLQDAGLHKQADTDITSSAHKTAVATSQEFLSAVTKGLPGRDGKLSRDPALLRDYLDKKVFPMSDNAKMGTEAKYAKPLEPVRRPDKANPDGVRDDGKELPY